MYTVSNPLGVPIVIGALGLAEVSSPSGCPVANLDVSQAGFVGALVVPANGSNETEEPISLLDTDTNQNACQNVTFNFSYSGSAVYQADRRGRVADDGIPTTTLAPGAADIIRVAGGDRVLTAIAVSQHSFGNGLAASVVITRSDQYPDALAGTPLAAREQAPLLLTAPTTLDPRVEVELERVLKRGRVVYVLGGSDAIAPTMAQRIRNDGYRVVRLAGPNRFATAVAIAVATLGQPKDHPPDDRHESGRRPGRPVRPQRRRSVAWSC